jgi:hypothetical protein
VALFLSLLVGGLVFAFVFGLLLSNQWAAFARNLQLSFLIGILPALYFRIGAHQRANAKCEGFHDGRLYFGSYADHDSQRIFLSFRNWPSPRTSGRYFGRIYGLGLLENGSPNLRH